MSNIKKGEKNPMYGKPKSDAFLACQTRDKTGANNPQYGVKKSEETLAKLFPLNPVGARYAQGLFYIL